MTIRKILIVATLVLCQPAFALVDGIETPPDGIILPATVNGMVSFKVYCSDDECKDEYKRARLTANTTFQLDGKVVKYEEFRREYAAMQVGENSYALVGYDTETNTVVKIEIRR